MSWAEIGSLKGPKGDKGDTGSQGPVGYYVLSGPSDPVDIIGREGDYYVNFTDHIFFGPKTSQGWGTGVSMVGVKGDKGDKGESGDSLIVSGATPPTDTTKLWYDTSTVVSG